MRKIFYPILFGLLLLPMRLSIADETKIGVIVPLTGPFARYGAKIQRAIEKFSSNQVSFVYEDEGCDPKMAITAYKKLTEINKISLFLGPWCGSPQSVVAPQLRRSGQLAVLGSSAPQSVYSTSNGNMLSVQHSIEAESTFLGEKLNKIGVNSVVIIFKENAFSRAHEAAFRRSFKGKILETFAYSSDDLSDLKSIALKVKQMQPSALYVPDAFPLMSGLTKELRSIAAERTIYSVYSAQSADVITALGEDSKHLVFSYPDIGDKDALDHFPNLATKILVQAAKSCRGQASCVRETISKQNSFDEHGVMSGRLILKTIKDGKFVPLTEVSPS